MRRFGWRPDTPDARDHTQVERYGAALPRAVDLRPGMPPVYDQKSLGSCTGNAIAAAFDYERHRQGLPFMSPSRLFVYYCERSLEGTIRSDAGAEIRDGIKSVARWGVPPETAWPYDVSRFTRKPPANAYALAAGNQALKYLRCSGSIASLRQALADGFPVIFGFTVYESFESDAVAKSGAVPMPQPHERAIGGHAVLAAGYNDTRGMLLVRNSWGTGWGEGGYFWMPYAYVSNASLADDFWTLRLVERGTSSAAA